MSRLIQIADRALNTPLLITPEKAKVVMSVLAGRIGINAPEAANAPDASQFVGQRSTARDDGSRASSPYRITANGIAIITINGSLVARGAWIGADSGLVSYEGIQYQLQHAASNPDVRAVILDEHTPGGECIGAFETADMVRELNGTKPVIAVVNGMAASAGYAIASGAQEIVTTRGGYSGSIGVVLVHADFSKNLASDGIDPTMIFAGAHKVDGNPYEPLTDAVRSDLQLRVNETYEQFLSTVEMGRGKRLTADMARATEARTLVGQVAVDAGLADRVGTFESVLSELSRATGANQTRRTNMSTNEPNANQDAGIPKADHDAAVSAAKLEGAAEERERLTGILAAEGVAGNAARMMAAMELAGDAPTMSVEKVVAHASKAGTAETNEPDASLQNRQNLPDSLGQVSSTQKPAKSGLTSMIDAKVAPR